MSQEIQVVQICKHKKCAEPAVYRYETSKRLVYCARHTKRRLILSSASERCVFKNCRLVAIYRYALGIYTHCFYHKYDGQICSPGLCNVCGMLATYKCIKTKSFYCRYDKTGSCYNMKIKKCYNSVYECAESDIDHCLLTKHSCVVKNCSANAGHFVSNQYPTHCYKHSIGEVNAGEVGEVHAGVNAGEVNAGEVGEVHAGVNVSGEDLKPFNIEDYLV